MAFVRNHHIYCKENNIQDFQKTRFSLSLSFESLVTLYTKKQFLCCPFSTCKKKKLAIDISYITPFLIVIWEIPYPIIPLIEAITYIGDRGSDSNPRPSKLNLLKCTLLF